MIFIHQLSAGTILKDNGAYKFVSDTYAGSEFISLNSVIVYLINPETIIFLT